MRCFTMWLHMSLAIATVTTCWRKHLLKWAFKVNISHFVSFVHNIPHFSVYHHILKHQPPNADWSKGHLNMGHMKCGRYVLPKIVLFGNVFSMFIILLYTNTLYDLHYCATHEIHKKENVLVCTLGITLSTKHTIWSLEGSLFIILSVVPYKFRHIL